MKIVKYYYQYLLEHKDKHKFGGLILIPELNETNNGIDWTIKNPNDVSFSYFGVYWYTYSLFYEFLDIISNYNANIVEPNVYFDGKLLDKRRNVYISEKDYIKSVKYLSKINYFQYEDFEFNLSFVNDDSLSFKYLDDEFTINCKFIVSNINIKLDDGEISHSLRDLKAQLYGINEDDLFIDRLNNLFYDFDRFMRDERPALINLDSYVNYNVAFFGEDGKEIRYW